MSSPHPYGSRVPLPGRILCAIRLHLQIPEFADMPQTILEGIACVLSEKVVPHSGVVYCQGDEVEDLYLIYKGSVKVRSLPEYRQQPWPWGHSTTFSVQTGSRGTFSSCKQAV